MDLAKYGPWALIVGGSEGAGAAFARKLASDGFKLVLTARKTGPLEDLAAELRGQGAEVRTLSADLKQLEVFHAGANDTRGNFVELPREVTQGVIQITVVGQSDFARHYGGLMCQRRRGGMILCGSLSSYMGAASLAAYTAAKAYSRIFSEALWSECGAFGVDVLHLNVGFTGTPAMARLGMDISQAQSPDDLAQEGLDNIANGPVWIAGGEANWERARQRSVIDNRREAIEKFATPPRDVMEEKE